MSDARPSRRRTIGVPLAISSIILILLIWATPLADFQEVLGSADPVYLWFAAAAILAVLLCRAKRFHALWKLGQQNIGYSRALRITSLHHAAFATFPSGAGDITLPLITRSVHGGSLADATAILLMMRMQDLVILVGLCLAAAASYLETQAFAIAAAIFVTIIAIPLAARVDRFAAALSVPIDRLSRFAGAKLQNFAGRLLESCHAAIESSRLAEGKFARLTAPVWTALSWLSAAAGILFLFSAFGQSLSLPEAILLIAGLNLMGAVAAFTVGGLGVAEAGLAGLLLLLGWPGEIALPLALLVRPVLLGLNVIVALALDGSVRLILYLAQPFARQ